MIGDPTRTIAQRRKDKAWLLWDLKGRRLDLRASATTPGRDPFMRGLDWHAYDRCERLISLVREIQACDGRASPFE